MGGNYPFLINKQDAIDIIGEDETNYLMELANG